jgi:hypothetical protein
MTSLTLRSFALLLVACGGTTTPSESAPGSPEAEAPTVGVYHLDQVDATNLEIRADGAFQWTIEGCDFGGGQCGSWEKKDGKLVLSGGPPGLEWSHDGSFKAKLRALVVTRDGDDLLVAGQTETGESFTQTWKKGRSCAICGGQLGPTGQELCDAPLPSKCAN